MSRVNLVVAFLQSRGVTHLVVGCNAASTVTPFLNLNGMQLVNIIEAAIGLTQRLRPARLALIGGRRTVSSGIYRRAFAGRGIDVTQRIAQPLSALIENGDVSSMALRELCRKILLPVKKCSHLLLACTHYPAVSSVLKEFVSEATVVIDPVSEVVDQIKRWKLPAGGADQFYTTGAPENMKRSAQIAFRVKIKTIRKIAL